MEKDKRYGLQLRVKPGQQKKPAARPPLATPLAFRDDDDDNIETEISRQAYKKKNLKEVEEQHKKALEEDPSVFDYDGVYDKMKAKSILPRAQDKQERKPKYILALMEKAKKREREQDIIYERKLAKERSQEDHMYAEKDKFVTGAYKRKLAEQAKWLEEERIRELLEQKDDVTKKSDISDFYFNLSNNIAFGGGESSVKKPIDEVAIQSPDTDTKRHDKEDSPEKKSKEEEAKPEKDKSVIKSKEEETVPEEGKSVIEPVIASEEPKQDHHKRKEDALAAAKERFLARKKAKEQIDL